MLYGREFAPAKINLFLHVGPIDADGYHPISSLIAFAGVGDEVTMRASPAMEFSLGGPFAPQLPGGGDNLVVKARDMILLRSGLETAPFVLELRKNLPIAAGLGGGSADAAAVLRLVGPRLGLKRNTLLEIARSLGADVSACLESRSVMAAGRGDILSPAPALPRLDLVLVNPLVASLTADVYRSYDRAPLTADVPAAPTKFATALEAVAFLGACRNDLEPAAIALLPMIATVLDALKARPETQLARMSGSGATCFAICASAADANRVTTALTRGARDWWVRQTVLGGADE